MSNAKLIALYSSTMQSGKSTVAETLQLSRGYKLIKFADPFKAFIKDLLVQGGAPLPAAERMIEDGTLKEKPIPGLGGVSVRRMLQTLGSEWGREQVHPDLWVQILARRVEECFASGVPVVVDDLRFPNEYEAILKLGGTPIRVVRPSAVSYAGHKSEGLLDSYPMMELINSGSVDELRACALRLPELIATHSTRT